MQRWQDINNWLLWVGGIYKLTVLYYSFNFLCNGKRMQENCFSSVYIEEKEFQENQKLKSYVSIQ